MNYDDTIGLHPETELRSAHDTALALQRGKGGRVTVISAPSRPSDAANGRMSVTSEGRWYYITRRLELRQGWAAHREALDELFSDEFQQLVVEFDSMDDSFDALVDRLEEIADASGGDVDDDDRHQRVTYSREGARFTFDLEKRRLEIAFGRKSALELVDAAQQFQLGVGRSSPMLAAPSRRSRDADDEA